MSLHKLAVLSRRSLRLSRLLQIALPVAFWLAGEALVSLTGLPLPAGIVGMFFVLALLASGRLSLASMRRGAQWWLAEMLLFFVPAVLAVMDHHEFLGWLGVKIMAVILFGTLIVMSVTALAIDLCWRMTSGRGAARHAVE